MSHKNKKRRYTRIDYYNSMKKIAKGICIWQRTVLMNFYLIANYTQHFEINSLIFESFIVYYQYSYTMT